jgi:hypothetical protein
MDGFQEYPKWIEVDGDGDPHYPGHMLVNNEDEELAAPTPKAKTKADPK